MLRQNEFYTATEDGVKYDIYPAFLYIATHPTAGDLIVGTGGARKIRWSSSQHEGKRGGARVIYYYYDRSIPVFLFTAYGKNEKANLTQAECSALKVIIKQIVSIYKGDKNE
ncbi:MAG: type II toxin-antitoxin system RelE/ParE family toxin [Gammaproteobacteria bacterium]|nr:type II toxin-antitoxin system RelE/ParE family toxin [Gammaproteobacteria bacterium]